MPRRNGNSPPPWPTGAMSCRDRTVQLITFASWCGGIPTTYHSACADEASRSGVKILRVTDGLAELAVQAAAEEIQEIYGTDTGTRICRNALHSRLAQLGIHVPEIAPPEASL